MFSELKKVVKNLFRKKPDGRNPHEDHPETPARTDTSANDLPVLSENKDFHTLFGVEKTVSGPGPATDMPDTDSTPPRPVLKKKKKEKSSSVKHFNKHGMPVLNSDMEVGELFEKARQNTSEFKTKDNRVSEIFHPSGHRPKPSPATSSEKIPAGRQKARLNKHGLPILHQETDLGRLFTPKTDRKIPSSTSNGETFILPETPEQENFSELLEQSLSGKNQRALLKAKKDHLYPRKPLTIKQRIKRYPPPQGQMDLHGYTAQQAQQRVDAYLRNAYHRQIFTLRLIVGKGLHSEFGPVLPDVVEDKLIELKRQNIVLAYEWDKKKKSKSGAVIVYLAVYG
jgi:DNA-nicking Smr family endonuclease